MPQTLQHNAAHCEAVFLYPSSSKKLRLEPFALNSVNEAHNHYVHTKELFLCSLTRNTIMCVAQKVLQIYIYIYRCIVSIVAIVERPYDCKLKIIVLFYHETQLLNFILNKIGAGEPTNDKQEIKR